MPDDMGLVERLRYRVNNPSAWDAFDQAASDDFSSAAAAIERLLAERDRCHERLEIDHYFKLGDNDDQDLERVEIPMDERATFPDGISARDATIELIQADLAETATQRDRLREALREAYALLLAPAEDIKDGVLSRARQALQDSKT